MSNDTVTMKVARGFYKFVPKDVYEQLPDKIPYPVALAAIKEIQDALNNIKVNDMYTINAILDILAKYDIYTRE